MTRSIASRKAVVIESGTGSLPGEGLTCFAGYALAWFITDRFG